MQTNNIELTRINNDYRNTPRYVFHFLKIVTEAERVSCDELAQKTGDIFGIDTMYKFAVNKARKIHGRKFHNKRYGGGIVVASYLNPNQLAEQIANLRDGRECTI